MVGTVGPMRRPIAVAILAGAVLTACTSGKSARPGPTTSPPPSSSITAGPPVVLASGLEVPWGVAFLPDGSALVSERISHRIVRVDAQGRVSPVGEVPGVADDAGEGGLLGVALSPDNRGALRVPDLRHR